MNLLDPRVEIKQFKLKPETSGYDRKDLSPLAFESQAIEIDKSFLDAEQQLVSAETAQTKEQALTKLDSAYAVMFTKLQILLNFGENVGYENRNYRTDTATINSMLQLFQRRQNLIKKALGDFEWLQKSITAAEINHIAKSNKVPRLKSYSYEDLFYISYVTPPEGIFADELSIKTWLEAVKARCKHSPSFDEERPNAHATVSVNDFPGFEEKILALISTSK